MGEPIQFEQLIIEHDGGKNDIVVWNRAMMLLSSNDEVYVRLHRVLGRIENVVSPRS